MKALEAFTPKEVRTCSRLLRKMAQSGHAIEDLHAYADYLGEVGTRGAGIKFHGKRTPEEKVERKRRLNQERFGRIKHRP